jgi:hypothetical protein
MAKNIIDIENSWYEFIHSLPEPTIFCPNFYWGLVINNLIPFISPERTSYYCDVRCWTNQCDRTIVLIFQDDDNPSMSITNACEYICFAFYHEHIRNGLLNHDVHIQQITWFESYSCYTYRVYDDKEEDICFSEIKFKVGIDNQLHFPHWKYYSKEQFDSELSLPF